MNIAIIPARIGSKRIRKKNIKLFYGKPLISYSINLAKNSKIFDNIIVSTDDIEIKNISEEYGADVPFLRPKNLSDDITPTLPVISHAINECSKLGLKFKNVCCIYPTAPFVKISDILSSYKLLNQNKKYFCFPITEFPSSIFRSFTIDNKFKIKPLYPQNELKRTQDLKPVYFDCGQFYWGTKENWLNSSKIHSNGLGYIVPNWRVVDLDTEQDWKRAELLKKIIK